MLKKLLQGLSAFGGGGAAGGAAAGILGGISKAVPVLQGAMAIYGIGKQIGDAIAAKKKADDLERANKKRMEQVRSRLEVNKLESVQLPLESYEKALMANVASGQQALTQLAEADPRTLAAGVGKTVQAVQEGQENIRQKMAEDIYQRDVSIEARDRENQLAMSELDLAEIEGVQEKLKELDERRAQQLSGAIKGIGQGMQNIYGSQPLYGFQPPAPMAPSSPMATPMAPPNIGFNRQLLPPSPFAQQYLYSPLQVPTYIP